MPGFLYYVPGAKHEGDVRSALASAPYILDDRYSKPGFAHAGDGPKGSGWFVAHMVGGAYPEFAYAPDRQIWTEEPGGTWWSDTRRRLLRARRTWRSTPCSRGRWSSSATAARG